MTIKVKPIFQTYNTNREVLTLCHGHIELWESARLININKLNFANLFTPQKIFHRLMWRA